MSARSPLDGIELLLIDGNNYLHRQRLGTGEAAIRGVLVGLQRALPRTVRAVLMLDGHPAPGTPLQQKVSPLLELRHSGSRTADDAIVADVAALPWSARGHTVVATDDRALTERARSAGALTRRLDWLASLPPAQNTPPTRGSTLGSRPDKRADRGPR